MAIAGVLQDCKFISMLTLRVHHLDPVPLSYSVNFGLLLQFGYD